MIIGLETKHVYPVLFQQFKCPRHVHKQEDFIVLSLLINPRACLIESPSNNDVPIGSLRYGQFEFFKQICNHLQFDIIFGNGHND